MIGYAFVLAIVYAIVVIPLLGQQITYRATVSGVPLIALLENGTAMYVKKDWSEYTVCGQEGRLHFIRKKRDAYCPNAYDVRVESGAANRICVGCLSYRQYYNDKALTFFHISNETGYSAAAIHGMWNGFYLGQPLADGEFTHSTGHCTKLFEGTWSCDKGSSYKTVKGGMCWDGISYSSTGTTGARKTFYCSKGEGVKIIYMFTHTKSNLIAPQNQYNMSSGGNDINWFFPSKTSVIKTERIIAVPTETKIVAGLHSVRVNEIADNVNAVYLGRLNSTTIVRDKRSTDVETHHREKRQFVDVGLTITVGVLTATVATISDSVKDIANNLDTWVTPNIELNRDLINNLSVEVTRNGLEDFTTQQGLKQSQIQIDHGSALSAELRTRVNTAQETADEAIASNLVGQISNKRIEDSLVAEALRQCREASNCTCKLLYQTPGIFNKMIRVQQCTFYTAVNGAAPLKSSHPSIADFAGKWRYIDAGTVKTVSNPRLTLSTTGIYFRPINQSDVTGSFWNTYQQKYGVARIGTFDQFIDHLDEYKITYVFVNNLYMQNPIVFQNKHLLELEYVAYHRGAALKDLPDGLYMVECDKLSNLDGNDITYKELPKKDTSSKLDSTTTNTTTGIDKYTGEYCNVPLSVSELVTVISSMVKFDASSKKFADMVKDLPGFPDLIEDIYNGVKDAAGKVGDWILKATGLEFLKGFFGEITIKAAFFMSIIALAISLLCAAGITFLFKKWSGGNTGFTSAPVERRQEIPSSATPVASDERF